MSLERTDTESSRSSKPKKNLLRPLYDWMLSWAENKYAVTALGFISFIESSVFPIPPDILLIALVLGAGTRWKWFALVCSTASVLGGAFGYWVGAVAFDTVGIWVFESLLHLKFETINGKQDILLPAYLTTNLGEFLGSSYLFAVYEKWNAWIVFLFGLSPLPYKLVTISAGFARIDLAIFIGASIVSRSLRFFLVAWIISRWGEPAKAFIEKYFGPLTYAAFALIALIAIVLSF